MNYDPIELHLNYTKINSSCPEHMLNPLEMKRKDVLNRDLSLPSLPGSSVKFFASGVNIFSCLVSNI